MIFLDRRSADPPSRRIVLCRLGGIGDVIHTLPLAKYLKKKYPQSSIEYITSSDVAELISQGCSYIDKVWSFDKKRKKEFFKDFLADKIKVDYFFNLHSSFSFFFHNIFYIRARKFFQYKKDLSLHAVVNFAKTYKSSISAFELDMKTILVNNYEEILRSHGLEPGKYSCFVIGVGNVRPHRAWQFENWLSLTKKFLNTEKDFKVVFLGGEHEKKILESWIKLAKEISAYKDEDGSIEQLPGFKGRAINLTGRLSLLEVSKILSKSLHVVSCDTGLLHLASALSVKVVGLYGPTLPKRSGPFTSDCKILQAKNCECIGFLKDVKRCKKTNELSGYCMNSLTVNEVLSNISFDLVKN